MTTSADPTTGATHLNPTAQDMVEWLPTTVADHRIRYGEDAQQFGDLRLPPTPAPSDGHPVIVVIHGGGYSPNWPHDHCAPLAEDLTAAGAATWTIEYRKPGQTGGGWPGTWLDIAAAFDHLRVIAEQHPIDLARVVVVGHSAGGTFGSWAAGRATIPAGSEVHVADPLPLSGVVTLAGMLDLQAFLEEEPEPSSHVHRLVGADGASDDAAWTARLAEISPSVRGGAVSVPQALVIGSLDDPGMIEQSRAYVAEAEAAGRPVSFDFLEGANHFDMVDTRGGAWPLIAAHALSLAGIEVSA